MYQKLLKLETIRAISQNVEQLIEDVEYDYPKYVTDGLKDGAVFLTMAYKYLKIAHEDMEKLKNE